MRVAAGGGDGVVWFPAVEVSRSPGLAEPLLSVQVAIPGPCAPSVQPKPVATLCPTAYVSPPAGEVICAVGAAATV